MSTPEITVVGTACVGIVWGVPKHQSKEIIGLPPDTKRVKVKFRNTGFARVYIKTSTGIRQFFLADKGEKFEVILEQGANYVMDKS